MSARASRRWRLRAWGAGNELLKDSTCIGDAALDEALKAVERDPATKRHRVDPL